MDGAETNSVSSELSQFCDIAILPYATTDNRNRCVGLELGEIRPGMRLGGLAGHSSPAELGQRAGDIREDGLPRHAVDVKCFREFGKPFGEPHAVDDREFDQQRMVTLPFQGFTCPHGVVFKFGKVFAVLVVRTRDVQLHPDQLTAVEATSHVRHASQIVFLVDGSDYCLFLAADFEADIFQPGLKTHIGQPDGIDRAAGDGADAPPGAPQAEIAFAGLEGCGFGNNRE